MPRSQSVPVPMHLIIYKTPTSIITLAPPANLVTMAGFFLTNEKESRGSGPCPRSHSLRESPGSRDSNPTLFLRHHATPEGQLSALCPLNNLAAGQGFSADEGRREGETGQFGDNLDRLGEETGWRTRGLDEDV